MNLLRSRLLAPPPPSTPAPPGALRIAHRGGLAHGPENSLAAIRAAARLGADAVELDVRHRDGRLICAHDPGQEGPLAADALALALDLGLRVELDLKSRGFGPAVQQVAEVVDALGAHERTWVSTFQPLTAWRLRHADPRLVVGWAVASSAVERLPLWMGWVRWLGVQVIAPHKGLVDPVRLAAWHALGLTVETWCVDAENQEVWLEQGVSVVLDSLEA